MEIRELRWGDFEALLETYWELYEERARGERVGIGLFDQRPSRPDEVEWFSTLFKRALEGEVFAVVADVDGRAVGLCDIHPVVRGGRGSDGGHYGELGILVDRRQRGQGIGRAMMVRALELARDRFDLVRLWVYATNERARGLYRSLGFEVTGRMPSAVRQLGEYIDAELMVVDLRRWSPPPANR